MIGRFWKDARWVSCTSYLTYVLTSPGRFLCVLIWLFNETIDYGNILVDIKNDGGPDFFPRLLEGTFRLS